MLSDKEYIRHSLETNLFYLRIVKEHAIFAAASLPPRDRAVTNKLVAMKNSFEELLSESIELADRAVNYEVLASDELVTDFTLAAEMKTQFLTGIPIDTELTRRELELRGEKPGRKMDGLYEEVEALNREAMVMTKSAIAFKTKLLKSILECKAFSYTYPAMLEHVIEESRYYVTMLEKLEKRDAIDSVKEIFKEEINWNHIMEEHSKFIRGYLDSEEEKLFNKANSFAKEFDRLLEKTKQAADNPNMLPEVTKESLKHVIGLRNFKVQGTEGILACKIKSLILPLLSDHVLREANHYLRLLKTFEKMV
ncbi:MAG: hypothetical protein APF77_11670 [Clostridia bacterium BRH_c25]|nr:MAG: hypothetical protein APF77_11670 [Clostridia bacterium BRH_c25]